MTPDEARLVGEGFLSVALAGTTHETSEETLKVLLKRTTGARRGYGGQEVFLGENVTPLVSSALAGSRVAHECLCEIAAEITGRHEALPEDLQRYVVSDAPKFRASGGRPAQPDWIRHAAIAGAVAVLHEMHGVPFYRNRATADRDSACSIIADVLSERDRHRPIEQRINRGEAAIEKIAKRYRDLGVSLFIEKGRLPLSEKTP